jgi:uncharacterized membrane-anchored protein YjiN (DUF445 family)
MAMNRKEKLLVVWILVVVAFGFLFHHFLSWTVWAFQRAVAFSFLPPGLVNFAAGICCLNPFP